MFAGWSRYSRFVLVTSFALLLALIALLLVPGTAAPAAPAPRLLVLVVFDQMRGDYLKRWQPLFGKGGFRRLQEEGAWFTDCHYPYSFTVTGAGHASLLTGCSPNRHGIVGNDWYDRETHAPVNCVASARYEQVPPVEPDAGGVGGRRRLAASPKLLESLTVGDVLKEQSPKSRVVAISFKDRAAVLPGGKSADACYWQDGRGRFVTSTYYPHPHAWVADFNKGRPADRYFGKDWERVRPDLDYVRYSGPDDVEGEGKGVAQGRTFPHPMKGGLDKPGPKYYQALFTSPYGNDLVLDFAKRAIDEENLGRGPAPDLLCISFSSNDGIGHIWGPDSQEVLDITLRSDQIMRDLLTHLDDRVGRGNYLMAVTADHGVCPVPEVSQSRGLVARRLGDAMLKAEAEDFLAQTFGDKTKSGRWLETTEVHYFPWVYLNLQTVREHKLEPEVVAAALANWLRRQPGIAAAYTRTQLAEAPAGDAMLERVRRSYYSKRCGDVVAVEQPYHLFLPVLPSATDSMATSHGSPYFYDTHVPLLIYGPGIPAGQHGELVTPQAIAAIFAWSLGLPPPSDAEAPVPASLWAK